VDSQEESTEEMEQPGARQVDEDWVAGFRIVSGVQGLENSGGVPRLAGRAGWGGLAGHGEGEGDGVEDTRGAAQPMGQGREDGWEALLQAAKRCSVEGRMESGGGCVSDSEECTGPHLGKRPGQEQEGVRDSVKRPRLLGQRRGDGGGQRLGRSLEQPQSPRRVSHGVTVGRHQASAECQAWLETDQIARGELKVPRLRSGAPRAPLRGALVGATSSKEPMVDSLGRGLDGDSASMEPTDRPDVVGSASSQVTTLGSQGSGAYEDSVGMSWGSLASSQRTTLGSQGGGAKEGSVGMEGPVLGSEASSLGREPVAHTRVQAQGGTRQVGAGCGATQRGGMAEESDGEDLVWEDEVAGEEHSDTGEDTEGEEEGTEVTASSEVGTAGGASVGAPSRRPPRPRVQLDPDREASNACWEDLGQAPWSGFRVGRPLPVMVVLDWMAGSQSLKKSVKELDKAAIMKLSVGAGLPAKHHKGIVYVGLDKQEWWWSHSMMGWVQNIPVDLMHMSYTQIVDKVQGQLNQAAGRQVDMTVVMLAMSPCCKTFSRADSSNITRGHNYRLHGEGSWHRPPKDRTSQKGLEAHRADRMVKQGIRVAREAHRLGVPFYMENPVGSLARRPYMRRWVREWWGDWRWVVRKEVHYCAFEHFYHKPTHIWTNMIHWVPTGSTEDGLCGQKCSGGFWRRGRWVHRYRLSQDSKGAHGGQGRKAKKNMMPLALHVELLGASADRLYPL